MKLFAWIKELFTAIYRWFSRKFVNFRMTDNVYQQICSTIGARPAESGGMLGSSDGGKTIDAYYFDVSSANSSNTYTPDTNALNRIIGEWNQRGIQFCGMIHSHPLGYAGPSLPDYEYADRILTAMKLPRNLIYLPIVQVHDPAKHQITIHFYVRTDRQRKREDAA